MLGTVEIADRDPFARGFGIGVRLSRTGSRGPHCSVFNPRASGADVRRVEDFVVRGLEAVDSGASRKRGRRAVGAGLDA